MRIFFPSPSGRKCQKMFVCLKEEEEEKREIEVCLFSFVCECCRGSCGSKKSLRFFLLIHNRYDDMNFAQKSIRLGESKFLPLRKCSAFFFVILQLCRENDVLTAISIWLLSSARCSYFIARKNISPLKSPGVVFDEKTKKRVVL